MPRPSRALAGLVAVVAACGRGKPIAVSPPATAPSSTSAAPPAPGLDARLEAKLDERDRLEDWRSTVFATRIANPPVPRRARPLPKAGPLAVDAIREIRAYHYRNGYTNAHAVPVYDRFDPPYTSDGRLDGHVVPPEAVLTAAERDRVVGLLHAADEEEKDRLARGYERAVLRCLFDPHHVFVFFDAKGVPIGKIEVCLTCGELRAWPATESLGGEHTKILSDDEKHAYREIADAHGLAAWLYGDTPENEELDAYWKKTYGYVGEETPAGHARAKRLADRPSGAPPSTTPRAASPEDRARYCVWLRAEMSGRRRAGNWPVTGTFECKSGQQYSFMLDDVPVVNDCDKAPLCDAPFGAMESCLRASFLEGPEEVCDHGLPPACAPLATCLPYVRWGPRR